MRRKSLPESSLTIARGIAMIGFERPSKHGIWRPSEMPTEYGRRAPGHWPIQSNSFMMVTRRFAWESEIKSMIKRAISKLAMKIHDQNSHWFVLNANCAKVAAQTPG